MVSEMGLLWQMSQRLLRYLLDSAALLLIATPLVVSGAACQAQHSYALARTLWINALPWVAVSLQNVASAKNAWLGCSNLPWMQCGQRLLRLSWQQTL
jgi:hypothetical protein